MTPIRGWAPRCRKLVARAPFAKWRTLTFLAALRHDRIDAPCVLDGPINGQSFTAWVEQFLVPRLAPGDVVIMDNLGSHKGAAVRQAIGSAGAKLLFLPPYSPDFNPIAQVFAKLKLLLRKADERSGEATGQRIDSFLSAFPPQECAADLKNSGYISTQIDRSSGSEPAFGTTSRRRPLSCRLFRARALPTYDSEYRWPPSDRPAQSLSSYTSRPTRSAAKALRTLRRPAG